MAAGGGGGFNFSLPSTANSGFSFNAPSSAPAVTTSTASFSFGNSAPGTGGFNFGTPSSVSGGLNFGTSAASTGGGPSTGGGSSSVGTAVTSSISGFGNQVITSTGGSIFNNPVSSASSGSTSFNLGSGLANSGTSSFGLSNSALPLITSSQNSAPFSFALPSSTGGLNLLNPKPTAAFSITTLSTPISSNNFSAPSNATPTLNTGGFNFSSSSGLSITNSTTNSNVGAPAGGFSKIPPTSSVQSSGASNSSAVVFTPATTSILASKSTLPSSSVVSGFNFGTPLTTSAPLSTAISSTTTTVSTSSTPFGGFQLPTATSAPTPSLFSSGASAFSATGTITPSSTIPATLSTATTTSSLGGSGSGGGPNLSMRQLEEKLNKWLVELKEQEERFIRQAAHVNAWDQILQNGHDQVQSLKDTLHTVKSDQSRLEAELDFIRGQQEELERLLDPLEAAVSSTPATQLHQGDRQRDNMYHLALSLDGQLRQMTDDLGKVIEHLNSGSSSSQPNDPVNLVARILSAHMDSLKWVDQNTTLLSQKVEDLSRITSDTGRKI